MTNIKPIETEYKGYKFRSRLEARWAVFFDAIGAKWEYEPEGFELADGTRYLPDFLLHGVRGRGQENGDIYVEIKGVMTPDDLHKIEMFGSDDDEFKKQHRVIVFGQIPDAEWVPAHDGIGPYWRFDYWRGSDDDVFYNLEYSEGDNYWTEPKAGKGGGLVLDYPDDPYDYVDDNLTEAAFRKARQARFEHGEHGGASVAPRFTTEDVMKWARTNEPGLFALLSRCVVNVEADGKGDLFQRVYITASDQFTCECIRSHRSLIENHFATRVSVAFTESKPDARPNARIIAEETLQRIEKNDPSIAELSEDEKTMMASQCRRVIRAEALKERKSFLMAMVATCGNDKERKDTLDELVKTLEELKKIEKE